MPLFQRCRPPFTSVGRGSRVRLLDEARHGVDLRQARQLGARLDVAVAGLRLGRPHPEGDDAPGPRRRHRAVERRVQRRQVGDRVSRRPCSHSTASGSAWRSSRAAAAMAGALLRAAGSSRMRAPTIFASRNCSATRKRCASLQTTTGGAKPGADGAAGGLLHHGAPAADQRPELLRIALPRQRPEPAAGAAGQDHGYDRHAHSPLSRCRLTPKPPPEPGYRPACELRRPRSRAAAAASLQPRELGEPAVEEGHGVRRVGIVVPQPIGEASRRRWRRATRAACTRRSPPSCRRPRTRWRSPCGTRFAMPSRHSTARRARSRPGAAPACAAPRRRGGVPRRAGCAPACAGSPCPSRPRRPPPCRGRPGRSRRRPPPPGPSGKWLSASAGSSPVAARPARSVDQVHPSSRRDRQHGPHRPVARLAPLDHRGGPSAAARASSSVKPNRAKSSMRMG